MSNSARKGWLRPILDGTAARHVGGRERALRVPGHGDGAACMRWRGGGHAELPGRLGGAKRRSAAVLPPIGHYGGSAAAKHAGAGVPGRHRRQEGAKHACGASDKQARLRASSQTHSEHVTEVLSEKRH